ncbi:MAG: heme exporter protein CcmD [Hyphomicrobiales bacterium]|nr:heme exporter protein CcmD [Hyphomicrobiales bacterium]
MAEVLNFLQMGGYAMFVWGAFGITAIVLIALLVLSARSARRKQSLLAQLQNEMGRDRAS